MVKLSRFSPDQWALAGSGLMAGLALLWVGLGERRVGEVRQATLSELSGALGAEVFPVGSGEEGATAWTPPVPNADPEIWGFDLFTPPVIYYDPTTGRFSVASLETVELPQVPLVQPFGVRLLTVERQPYRLQLVGYAGTVDDPLGIFANEISGEGIVARSGHRFADLGIELESLVIRREELLVPESMPLREIVAEARVRDVRDATNRQLSSGRPAWNDQPIATIRLEASGEERRVQAGNRVELPDGVIDITGVFFGPDSVTAVKRLPDGTRESQRLEPELREQTQFGGDTLFETP